jgi:Holliday junction resolvase RusA-like endonuclease
MIRMKPNDAIRAGLIDPLLVNKVKKASGSGGVTAPAKKKRKTPKPAESLVEGGKAPGEGSLALDHAGVVQKAFLDFWITPVPKERPRVVRNKKTGKVQSFTPPRTSAFHGEIHRVLEEVMFGHRLMDGPLRSDMVFKMAVPKGWPSWRKEAAIKGIIRPTGRPDMDNLEKALLDAFNDYIIRDDALVIERFAQKIYSEKPGIEAKIERLLAGDIHITRAQADLILRIRGIRDDSGDYRFEE